MDFLECKSLFLRHEGTRKCIAAGELLNKNTRKKLLYFAVMTDNCLNSSAQFRYLENELLHNIEKDGTLASPVPEYQRNHNRWVVYKGLRDNAPAYQNKAVHRLEQTDAGSLRLYSMKKPVCAEPESGTTYVKRNKTCNEDIQKFTFGK